MVRHGNDSRTRPDQACHGDAIPPSHGKKQIIWTDLGQEYHDKAIGHVLSAEILLNGMVVFYIRKVGEDDEDEHSTICSNGPEVVEALKKLIDDNQ
jgi:hypothetical protein